MTRVDRDGRALLLFAAVSLGFVALGIAMLVRTRVNPQHYGDAVMAEYYLSMLCRCHWYGGALPWSIHAVAAPYRYRVLVPWLAGYLPFAGPTSLAVITYASLALFYFLTLLSCRRLGLSAGASVCALALPFVFESHLVNYFHPFLVEGFGLMIIAAMLYAFAIDSFWLFAAAGLCGIFAREVTWFVLPVWCARNLRRGVTLTIVGAVALLIERSVLWGPPVSYPIDPASIAMWHWHEPGNFFRDIRAVLGWEFGLTVLGIGLLPAKSFRTAGPMFVGLLGAACIASFLATDTARLFGVQFPIVVIAAAQLVTTLSERRHYLLLASLVGLVVVQYVVTPNNGLPFDPAAIAARLRPIRLGTLWTVAAAFMLRRELAERLRETLGMLRSRRWMQQAAMPDWSAVAVWVLLPVAAAGGLYWIADPEQREIDQAVRASAPGQFIRLTDSYTHYEMDGPAAAPLVVLAAGISEPSYVWDPTFTALARAGFRVLRYDYYGRGYSDRPDIAYTQEVYVRQLAELLDSQRITGPVHLGGLAFGASVITSFADQFPARVRSLIYVGPAFRGAAGTRETDPNLLRQKGFETAPVPPTVQSAGSIPILWDFTMAAFEEQWWAESQLGDFLHPGRFPDWPQRYRAQMQYRGFRRAQRSTLVSGATLDQAAELKRVGMHGRPVMVFWGKQDAIVPITLSATLTEAMPRARLVTVESSGHLPQWEQPAAVHPALVAFLRASPID
jgi:pimeloyl-ACP methyl ester carboxylesterase